MPKRSTMFGLQKQNKSVYIFQRGKGNNVKTLEVYNVLKKKKNTRGVQYKNTRGVQCKNTRGV